MTTSFCFAPPVGVQCSLLDEEEYSMTGSAAAASAAYRPRNDIQFHPDTTIRTSEATGSRRTTAPHSTSNRSLRKKDRSYQRFMPNVQIGWSVDEFVESCAAEDDGVEISLEQFKETEEPIQEEEEDEELEDKEPPLDDIIEIFARDDPKKSQKFWLKPKKRTSFKENNENTSIAATVETAITAEEASERSVQEETSRSRFSKLKRVVSLSKRSTSNMSKNHFFEGILEPDNS